MNKFIKKISALGTFALLPVAAAHGAEIFTFESGPEGFHTKTHFYDTGREVVAFDAQFTPAAAEAAIRFLRTKTASPLAYLVITHPNPDKFNGAPVFRAAGAKVVASERTAAALPTVHVYKKNFFENVARMFPAGTYPALAVIDETFSERATLSLSAGRVELAELAQAGVSGNQTVALLPEMNAVVVGDLVHGRAHAWLEGGITANGPRPELNGWIADLRELAAMPELNDETRVLGGRGETLGLKMAVAEQVAYLEKADEIVTSYVKALPNARAELSGPAAASHWQNLQAQFAAAFPRHGLAYLIQYGVYGLALQRI